MTLTQIKTAVELGFTVHYGSDAYIVIKDSVGQWLIKCLINNYCMGLTWTDGVTMNGDEEKFYIK